MKIHKKILGIFQAVIILAALFSPTLVLAAPPPTSQGYNASSNLLPGTMVSVTGPNYQSVEPATAANRQLLTGVIVSPSDSLLTFTAGTTRVQVASGGVVDTQISTINGDIRSGDVLTVSPIAGVAMKATVSGKVIGVAQAAFTSTSKGTKTTVKDNKGKELGVTIGKIPVQVGIQDWTAVGSNSSPILNSVRGLVSNTVGHPVTNAQAAIVLGIILVAIIASAIILYSAVSASIRSIGRNPLSRRIISRSMLGMVVLVAVILVGAVSAIYLILRS